MEAMITKEDVGLTQTMAGHNKEVIGLILISMIPLIKDIGMISSMALGPLWWALALLDKYMLLPFRKTLLLILLLFWILLVLLLISRLIARRSATVYNKYSNQKNKQYHNYFLHNA